MTPVNSSNIYLTVSSSSSESFWSLHGYGRTAEIDIRGNVSYPSQTEALQAGLLAASKMKLKNVRTTDNALTHHWPPKPWWHYDQIRLAFESENGDISYINGQKPNGLYVPSTPLPWLLMMDLVGSPKAAYEIDGSEILVMAPDRSISRLPPGYVEIAPIRPSVNSTTDEMSYVLSLLAASIKNPHQIITTNSITRECIEEACMRLEARQFPVHAIVADPFTVQDISAVCDECFTYDPAKRPSSSPVVLNKRELLMVDCHILDPRTVYVTTSPDYLGVYALFDSPTFDDIGMAILDNGGVIKIEVNNVAAMDPGL